MTHLLSPGPAPDAMPGPTHYHSMAMPRYLRWSVSVTTGIILQFVFQIALLATVVGTGRKELTGFTAAVVTFGAGLINVLCALAINDWLASKYPAEARSSRRSPPAPSHPPTRTDQHR